jgi:hypothetical protein
MRTTHIAASTVIASSARGRIDVRTARRRILRGTREWGREPIPLELLVEWR